MIYINSNHYFNKIVFGADQQDYSKKMENDRTAQYRFSHLIVEQSVFRIAEEYVREDRLIIGDDAPVTNIREFVDQKTNEWAPKVTKVLIIS